MEIQGRVLGLYIENHLSTSEETKTSFIIVADKTRE